MHLPPLIQDLAVILAVAGVMSLIFQRIRQPVVLGYLIAGIVVGPHTPPFSFVSDLPNIRTWAELGVIFLMFSLGLEFSFRKLARVGISAGITAGTEVLFFIPAGYFVGKLFGWSSIDSIFLGAILSISSTTIIIKALDELKLKTRRFAELIFAVLIVEDLIAILLLVALTTVATSETISGMALLTATGKLVLVVGGWIVAGYFVVPRFMRYVGRIGNNEMLTLVSLGLCLGLVVFATRFHYSAALGAFIMGSILSESPVLDRIEARMESLRDLFGAVFFVSIGMLIDPKMLWEHKGAVIILCLVTIVGKILSTGFGALISGQTFKNSVRVGFGLAQIGEFSFIIAGLGMTLKATSDFIYPIAVAVSLVTTFTTPYLIQLSGPLSEKLELALPPRIRDMLNRYAVWSQERRTETQRKKEFYGLLLRWLINGVVVSVIFALSYELFLPFLEQKDVATDEILPALSWIVAILISSPFIWAMISTFTRRSMANKRGTDSVKTFSLFFFQLLTLVWVGALSAKFFPARYVVLITSILVILLFVLFYRRLEAFYQWFEERFLSTFEAKDRQTNSQQTRRLAPWDAHLVTIKVHPNAAFTGKKLADIQLRNKYGVNVVTIKRGSESIVAPVPEEQVFPGDELIVLGTDEQIEKTRSFLDVPSISATKPRGIEGYDLKQIQIKDNGPLGSGVTIREAGIRERFGAMVVGIERNQKRIVNPDSDLKLLTGDTLWLVGSLENLARLRQELLVAEQGASSGDK